MRDRRARALEAFHLTPPIVESAAMQQANRSAILVTCAEPFLDWVNSFGDATVSMKELNNEPSFYLLPQWEWEDEFGSLLRQHYTDIFEQELYGWYTDESLWPRDRSVAMFERWFHVKRSSVVVDLSGAPYVLEDV